MSAPVLGLVTSQAALASTSLLSQMRLAVIFMGPQGYAAEGRYSPETAFAFMEKVDVRRAGALQNDFSKAVSKRDFHPTACNRFRATMSPYFDRQLQAITEASNPLQALQQAGFEALDNYDVLEDVVHAQLISEAGIRVFVDCFDPLVETELERLKSKIERKYFLHGYANLEQWAKGVRVFGIVGGVLCVADFVNALFSTQKINVSAHILGGVLSLLLALGAAEAIIARRAGYAEIVPRRGIGSENDAIRFNQYSALRDVLTIISSIPELAKFFDGEM